jgi:hypothetical protein
MTVFIQRSQLLRPADGEEKPAGRSLAGHGSRATVAEPSLKDAITPGRKSERLSSSPPLGAPSNRVALSFPTIKSKRPTPLAKSVPGVQDVENEISLKR